MTAQTKIIAIDDDPTGSQTVHSCLLLTRWDVDTLMEGLTDPSPLFFILSNTRAMEAERAAAVTREICRNLGTALERLAAEGRPVNPLVVSRSDSTLRGHYPVETDIIAAELGPFDAHFLVPAFFEGGRITRNGVHYLMVDGEPVPVSETEFARDSVFGYSTAYLPDYVEEKTAGAIPAQRVERFDLATLRNGDLKPRLRAMKDNACGVVDGECQADLDAFTRQLLAVAEEGRRFLFRSAASLLTSLAGLPPQPLPPGEMGGYVRNGRPGVFLVGSHVPTSSRQLRYLVDHTAITPIEVDLERLQKEPESLAEDIESALDRAMDQGTGAVLYTSRGEWQFADKAQRLAFGDAISDFLMERVRRLPRDIGFLVSKGGITSNDVLGKGLALRTSRVLGQIQAGCSVVRCPADHPRFPELPVVIFPGNVGRESSLADIYGILTHPGQGDDGAAGA